MAYPYDLSGITSANIKEREKILSSLFKGTCMSRKSMLIALQILKINRQLNISVILRKKKVETLRKDRLRRNIADHSEKMSKRIDLRCDVSGSMLTIEYLS